MTTRWTNETSARGRSLVRRFIAAQVVVFLLFGPHLAKLTRYQTRLLYLWEPVDLWVLFAGMVLLAVGCVVVGELVRWINNSILTRVFNHLFVVGLGAGLLANLWYHTSRPIGYHIGQGGMEIRTAWLVLIGLVGFSLARSSAPFVRPARRLCMIIAPAMLFVSVHLGRLQTYPPSLDALEPASSPNVMFTGSSSQSAHDVYVFIFDEWSYYRTYDNVAVGQTLENVVELSSQATTFVDAHSPSKVTRESIPQILFQTNDPVVIGDGRVGFDVAGSYVASQDRQSIFSVVDDRDYRKLMIGFVQPYRLWLGDQVDVCRTYCWHENRRGRSLSAGTAFHLYKAAEYWTDPWSILLRQKVRKHVRHAQAIEGHVRFNRDVLAVIEDQAENTFAVFHHLIPHGPYLLDENGEFCEAVDAVWWEYDLAGYTRNLAGMDRLVGKFVAAMKAAGKYDDALLIITSDHEWESDPEREAGRVTSPLTHVPLVVKFPGQTQPYTVNERFELRDLGSLIAYGLDSEPRPDGIEDIIASGRSFADGRRDSHRP